MLDALAAPEGKQSYRAPYRGLRGPLRLPRQDKRLVSSAEGELRPLPDQDRRQRSEPPQVLGPDLAHLANTAEPAAAPGMGCPSSYARLCETEALLAVGLNDGEALANL